MSAELSVLVVWSPSEREVASATLTLADGATLADALAATGWPALASAGQGEAAFAAAGLSAAVWSKPRPLAHALRDGDRIEVLRALTIAPMEARRARYEAAGGVKALRKRKHAAQFER